MEKDKYFMQIALDLAQKARGYTSPNPMVGAVIMKNNKIVGSGFHQRAGTAHAEIIALQQAGKEAKGATLYVTLEPCAHTGRTLPCTEKIIAAGIKRVVVAMTDPNPLVNGKGIQQLKAAGLEVKCGVLEQEARDLNEAFIKYITTKFPFTVIKAAMTLDGKIATRTKASRWITGAASRRFGHSLRHEYDAIMVGIGTVLTDNPRLNTRLPEGGKDPLRVIVDSTAKIPLSAHVVCENPEKTLLVTTKAAPREKIEALRQKGVEIISLSPTADGKVPLREMMLTLGQREIISVLVEGGSALNYALLAAGLVDKVHFFIAPKIFGGKEAPTPVGGQGVAAVNEAWQLSGVKYDFFEHDILVTGYVQYPKG
ncbi:MAG: bifunctional diaminohydroxyphosphoribosylaminopyrimidine deaminase/5-amino-6-(5-phosphoribosylamino)uracil reductase RibD [Firmicutes bacterium]|nr:bifunctional diaminohydroxyphosphoribosylaminopyrimidine deaminase/5-amino-6-(5-phosphoribosylamino)uracil reductase RibD [Bacillota bacterium]